MHKDMLRIAVVTVFILLIPLVLTLLNPNAEINGGSGGGFDWMPGDFAVMGALLFGTGLLLNFALRKAGKYKLPAVLAIVLGFLYIWAELAVGIFTNLGS